MKRTFRKSFEDGRQEVATVVQDTDAVTVARRDAATRSLGHPKRIPVKLCQGQSVAQEARAQELLLQGEGFEFDPTASDGDVDGADDNFIYLAVRKDKVDAAIECMAERDLPGVRSQRSLTSGTLTVADGAGQLFVLRSGHDASAVVRAQGPMAAVALILQANGYADLAYEQKGGPNKAESVTPLVARSLAKKLDPEMQTFLEAEGVVFQAVINSPAIRPAILM